MQRKIKIIVELIISLIMIYLVIIFTTIISFAPYNMTEIDYSSDFIGPIQIEKDTTTTTTITLTTVESAAGTTSSIITAILTSKSQSQAQAATTQEKITGLKATTTTLETIISKLTTLKTTKLTTTTTDTTEAIIETDILSVGNVRGTYYIPTSRQKGKKLKGGSGHYLIDCSVGNSDVKGSVASAFIYKNYGYNYNDKRTKLYLEIEDYSEMNGYYYLDDCDSGRYNLIDFFYYNGSTCPFSQRGVVKVKCYIVNY